MMKKKMRFSYIIRKMTWWRNLKSNFYNEIIEDYENCKLKDLKKMRENEYNDWNELINDKKWILNENKMFIWRY